MTNRVRAFVAAAIAFTAACTAFFVAHRTMGYWTVDDAGITYAYSFRLADDGSFAQLPESLPVEGYSNPFLFFLVAALRVIGCFDPITTHVWVETIAFGLMSALLFDFVRKSSAARYAAAGTTLFIALELIVPATWKWYRSGLENVYVSLALVAMFWLSGEARRGKRPTALVSILGLLTALMRPEAPVYVAAFFLGLCCCRPPDVPWRAHIKWLLVPAAIITTLFAAYLVWRFKTYGAWLPNTYYAKLDGTSDFVANVRYYVLEEVFRYCGSVFFVAALVPLALSPSGRSYAAFAVIMLLASLAMPVAGGSDMLGEHRFATPFLATVHVIAASAIATAQVTSRARRIAAALPVALACVVLVIAPPERPPLNDFTISRVAELHGARRIEHQRRLGLIVPVVVAPDAGGTLLVGSLQHIDNGYLTDFQMAHMPRKLEMQTQYQVSERLADLVDPNARWPFDRSLIGKRYLAEASSHMYARRDLVETTAEGDAPAAYEANDVRVTLSNNTVPFAGPRGLVRVELVVDWRGRPPAPDTVLKAWIPGGDRDEISLTPYATSEHSTTPQRRALLLQAPNLTGSHAVFFEVWRAKKLVFARHAMNITVLDSRDVLVVAEKIASSDPKVAVQQLAWLREQWIPRLGLSEQHRKQAHASDDGLRSLRWDARLATTSSLPRGFASLEHRVITAYMTATPCSQDSAAYRALCLGRRIDALRRLGYFAVVDTVPAVAAELARVRHALSTLARDDRYIALVGLTLARPQDIELQESLLHMRLSLTEYPPLPP